MNTTVNCDKNASSVDQRTDDGSLCFTSKEALTGNYADIARWHVSMTCYNLLYGRTYES